MPSKTKAEPYSPTGRLDNLIEQLDTLHASAEEIFDAYVAELRAQSPGIPVGVLRTCEITARAGQNLNYVAALRLLKEKFLRS